jgi:hypothetical protein
MLRESNLGDTGPVKLAQGRIYMNAGLERHFIDTNVLVYAHDLSAGEKNTEPGD